MLRIMRTRKPLPLPEVVLTTGALCAHKGIHGALSARLGKAELRSLSRESQKTRVGGGGAWFALKVDEEHEVLESPIPLPTPALSCASLKLKPVRAN